MNWLLEVSVFFCVFTVFESATRSASFLRHKNKRLTKVTKTVAIQTTPACVNYCLATDGCLEINIPTNGNHRCQLSDLGEMVDNNISDAYVVDKCAQEPRFCLNGGLCEPTRTSARCHCPDRYQGDRCDQCSERFQGEGCQECSPRFYGDECQQCSERFQGNGCQECVPRFQGYQCNTCADGHYGEDCGYAFVEFEKSDCSNHDDLDLLPNTDDLKPCKDCCGERQACGGFVLYNGLCYFKGLHCKDSLYNKNVYNIKPQYS